MATKPTNAEFGDIATALYAILHGYDVAYANLETEAQELEYQVAQGGLGAKVRLSKMNRVADIYFELSDRKSTRLNSSHSTLSRMPSSA